VNDLITEAKGWSDSIDLDHRSIDAAILSV